MYKVAIRDNATGEIRLCSQDLEWGPDKFWWLEGNMSCDCNRKAQFNIAGDAIPDAEPPCGEGMYTALYAELPNGTKILLEADRE